MTVRIASMVMAVRERESHAAYLAARLQCHVRFDDASEGPWGNARACWLQMAKDASATHCLLVQDDALLCQGFLDALQAAVEAQPWQAVNLFACWAFMLQARNEGSPWVVSESRCSGLAVVLPKPWVRTFVEWRDRWLSEHWTSSDGGLLLWLLHEGRGFYYTAPSLVQHAPWYASTLNGQENSDPDRQSPWFAADVDGADDVDWSRKPLHVPGRRQRYIAQCVPFLKPGVYWPPGGEPDPRFIAARHEPGLYGARRAL